MTATGVQGGMTAGDGKPGKDRRTWRFTPASGLLARRIAKIAETRGFAQIDVLTRWAEIVGPDIAHLARPEKIGYAKSGIGATLHLTCRAAAATEVQMMEETIRERVNACYGYNAIQRIRVHRADTRGFAESGRASYMPARRKRRGTARGMLDADARAEMEQDLQTIASDDLRQALGALGRGIAAQNRTGKEKDS
ncbi:MAG: DUF721 domain-containing protein [Rubricella sp.]